jgi:hypothetical protein
MGTEAASVLLFFIDGLGIGTRGPHNPLDGLSDAEPLAIFQEDIVGAALVAARSRAALDGVARDRAGTSPAPTVVYDGIVVATDACLGVEGRPQSASGQTTILTGVNAPAAIGMHKQGFPNPALLDIIREHSIFVQLKNRGVQSITFANTYTGQFFERRPRWISATTAAVEAAGLRFNVVGDLKRGRAVFHDFTNKLLIERGEDVEPRTPEEAGDVLANIASEHRFTLYEHFITDKIGHAQDWDAAQHALPMLARYIRRLLEKLDLDHTTVILTSDHGNIEDLSARNHTLNPVPTIIWGRNREQIASRIHSLVDITPAIVAALTAD